LEKLREEYTDYQEVLVTSGKYELLLVLEGNLVGNLKPGVCLSATGVLCLRWVCEASLQQDFVFKVLGLRPEIYQGIRSGLEPLMQFLHEADEFKRRTVLIRSLFANVYGLYHIKLGLTLAVVAHILGTCTSVLLIGDTATGKSLVMSVLAQRCQEITSYFSCLPSTQVSLCPSKLNLIDNFHILNRKNEVYRSIEGVSVIAAATSFSKDLIKEKIVKGSRKEFGEIRCKTDLLSANLDRFDLLLKASCYDDTAEYLKLKLEGGTMEDLEDLWMPETITEFLLRGQAEPQITDPGVNLVLERVHDMVRAAQHRSGGSGGVSVRLLESVIKLSKAHAALMQRTEVKIFDVVSVILLTTNAGADDTMSSSNCFKDPTDFDIETRHLLELLR
jgi:DNA replicative helicase MCM subunit Mcm2 (Cdc46/Mcm family)